MKKILAVVLSLMMVFSILPVSVMATEEAVTLTHSQFLNASDRYEKFIARNAGVPNFVTSDGQKLTPEEYLYSAADAVVDLSEGNKISAAYKKLDEISNKDARENVISGELNRGEYVALAKAVLTEIDSENKVSACFGTSLGAISPKNLSYVFAQVVQYYKYNKTLPASVEVEPWIGGFYAAPEVQPEAVTPEVEEVRVSSFINAAIRVKGFIEAQAALPASTQVDNQLFNMGQFLATALKVYLENATRGNIAVAYANTPSYPVELMKEALVLDKTQLDALFTAANELVASTAPASVTYGEDVIGFNSLVYAVASALAEIRNNNSITTLTVNDWKEISGTALPLPGSEPPVTPVDPTAPRVYGLHSVAVMGNWLENYLTTYGADLDVISPSGTWISRYVSLELTRLGSAEAFLTLAHTIYDLKSFANCKEYEGTVVYEGLKPVSFASKEAFVPGTVTKAEYLNIVEQILSYAAANGNLVPETTYCGLGGFGYETTMLLLIDIVQYADKNGVLPESVEIEKTWLDISYNPLPTPVPTEAPEVTEAPTLEPTVEPTVEPTLEPTIEPTVEPTLEPTVEPTIEPTPEETQKPAGDGIFTIDEIAQASKTALENYTSGTPFYKEGVEIDTLTVAQQNYYILAAQAIQDIYNGKATATYANASLNYNVPTLIANYNLTRNGVAPTEATQAFYMNFAIRQTVYVNGAGAGTVGASAGYPTTSGNANGFPVTDYSGQMTYEAGLLMFARVLAYYATNGNLPASVALEYVPAVEETDAPATDAPTTDTPATQAPETDAPTSEAPAAKPTGHPAFTTVANGTTFSVAEIAAAANQIISHFETYKELEPNDSVAKAVIVDGMCISDQDWSYVAAYTICGLSNAYPASGVSGYTASTEVAYKKVGKASVNAGTQYSGNLTVAQVAEAAWKACANYANNNGMVAASCGSVPGVSQLSYYTILLAEARILAYYAANGNLPASIVCDAVAYSASDSDSNVDANAPIVTSDPATIAPATVAPTTVAPVVTKEPVVTDAPAGDGIITIAELAQASKTAVDGYTSGKAFYKDGITVDGVSVPQHVYYYMISTALQDIYNNKTTATYTVAGYNCKPYEGTERNYDLTRNGSTPTEATQALYMNFAIRQTKYILGLGAGTIGAVAGYPTSDSNANGFAVTDYSGQMTYEVGLVMMARALAAYSTNGSLPATVALEYVPSVDPTEAPETDEPTQAPATQAPATTDPEAEATPTAAPSFTFSKIKLNSTFTVQEIAEAASTIVSQYDTYSSLKTNLSITKAVPMGGYVIKDEHWMYMAAYAINGLSGSYAASGLSGYTKDTAVTFKQMSKPNADANTAYTGETLTMAQLCEAIWKACASYANTNLRIAASCSSVPNVEQLSYYTMLVASARALKYFADNGSLPATVQCNAINFSKFDT